jgi:hypothetical protein
MLDNMPPEQSKSIAPLRASDSYGTGRIMGTTYNG